MIRYICIYLLISPLLQAKVFDISSQTISTFIRGSYGQSSLGEKAYSLSSGANTEFSDEVAVNTSGEFGLYTAAGNLGLRFSVELLQPKKMDNIIGADSGGSTLLNLTSTVTVQILKMGVEYSWFLTPESKVFALLSFGQATVNLTNDYSNISGYAVADFSERSTESLTMGEIMFGYEYNFSADTTILLDLGYRALQANGLTYKSDATTFLGGVSSGGEVLNSDGTKRTLDLGGLYAGIGFRFYINQ